MRAPTGIVRGALWGGVILGGTGFLCGFFGPIALSPESNQGPLLGIFITGPAGALLGLVLGAVTGALRIPPPASRIVLASACAILAATTLFFSTPEPTYRVGILDAEIRGCAPPRSRRSETIANWEQILARTSNIQGRAGWRQDFDRMLAEDSAVVLQLHVLRQTAVYENRKPWNQGVLEARPWVAKDADQSYFATYEGGSCDAYPEGTRTRFVASGEISHEWPPEILANLLDLQTVEPASEKYQRLVQE